MVESKDIKSWGRHFDTLLWTVTAIMAAAIGGLLVYVSSNFDVWFAVAGFILCIIAVYFASSFRELRHKMEKHYDNNIKEILNERRKFYQWPVYLLIFVILAVLWIKLLIENYKDLWCLWVIIGIIGIGLMIYCGYESRGEKR